MRLEAFSATTILLAVLVIAGCQNDGGPAISEKPAGPGLSRRPAEPKTSVEATTPKASDGSTARAEGASVDLFPGYVPAKRKPEELTLTAHPVAVAPVIDGRGDDPVWKAAPAITTLDFSSQRPITIKSVFTSTNVFFLVTYTKDAPALTHKTWLWDAKERVYREGPDREDVFIFKWSMSGNDVRLELRDPEPHRADIWFWKAHRSNPAGYADDKWQSVTTEPGRDARKMDAAKRPGLFFRREGDAGTSPFDEKFFFEYQGDRVEKYVSRQPQGSRADVRAKGVWAQGQWTIEFARKLQTGHDDDVGFARGGVYLFGVSLYEMAYGTPSAELSQPLYRTGDVFDRLLFTIPGSAGK